MKLAKIILFIIFLLLFAAILLLTFTHYEFSVVNDRVWLGVREVTAYSPQEGCDDPDSIMANGEVVHEGAAACPREIPLGTKIKIGNREFVCEDRLAREYDDRFDLFVWGYQEAKSFGVKNLLVEIKN